MARRSTAAVTDADTAPKKKASPNKNEDNTVTAVAEPVEATEPTETIEPTETVEPTEDETVDTSSVHAALATLLAGDLSVDPTKIDYSPVVSAYAALSSKSKRAATRELNTAAKDKLEAGDFDVARIVLLAEKATKASTPGAGRKPRAPHDVTSPVVEKLAAFQLAYGALSTNLPEGIAEDWKAQVEAAFESGQSEVTALIGWSNADVDTRGEAPAVSEAALRAVKIAFGNPFGKRDVGKHIEQVFADAAPGTFMSEAQLASATSAEYGGGAASLAAIRARLDGKRGLPDGFAITEQDGKRGVVKN